MLIMDHIYKDKYYWTGLQLVLRAVFFGLTALERNTNLMISAEVGGMAACIQATSNPFNNKMQNLQELLSFLNLHLLLIVSLYTESNDIVVELLISLFAIQFLFIVSRHAL